MADATSSSPIEPLVVRTHVTPWGFLFALPFAFVFSYVGARALDAHILPLQLSRLQDHPFWLFGAVLIGFALFLFLVGIGELASYLRPGVEVVMDDRGVTTFGLLGERRMAWSEITETHVEQGQLALKSVNRHRTRQRELRIHFNRLAVEPTELVARIQTHRPDLATERQAV